MPTGSTPHGIHWSQELPLIFLWMVAFNTAQTVMPIKPSDSVQKPIDHTYTNTNSFRLHRRCLYPFLSIWIIPAVNKNLNKHAFDYLVYELTTLAHFIYFNKSILPVNSLTLKGKGIFYFHIFHALLVWSLHVYTLRAPPST